MIAVAAAISKLIPITSLIAPVMAAKRGIDEAEEPRQRWVDGRRGPACPPPHLADISSQSALKCLVVRCQKVVRLRRRPSRCFAIIGDRAPRASFIQRQVLTERRTSRALPSSAKPDAANRLACRRRQQFAQAALNSLRMRASSPSARSFCRRLRWCRPGCCNSPKRALGGDWAQERPGCQVVHGGVIAKQLIFLRRKGGRAV